MGRNVVQCGVMWCKVAQCGVAMHCNEMTILKKNQKLNFEKSMEKGKRKKVEKGKDEKKIEKQFLKNIPKIKCLKNVFGSNPREDPPRENGRGEMGAGGEKNAKFWALPPFSTRQGPSRAPSGSSRWSTIMTRTAPTQTAPSPLLPTTKSLIYFLSRKKSKTYILKIKIQKIVQQKYFKMNFEFFLSFDGMVPSELKKKIEKKVEKESKKKQTKLKKRVKKENKI